MTEKLIMARIKQLPPLPLVAQKLIDLMKSDRCSADDVTQVLQGDQVLCGRVLKLANSSFYGLSGQVGSVSRAIVILGFSTIRSMALGIGLAEIIKKTADMADLAAFWKHSIVTSAACRALAKQSGLPDPEEVFIAGLMHDLGHLVLEMTAPGYSSSLIGLPPDEFMAAEKERMGMTHTRAGQQVMKHWKLPERLGNVLRFHHHPTFWSRDDSRFLGHVMLGDLFAAIFGESVEGAGDIADPIDLARNAGLSLQQTETLLAAAVQQIEHTREFLQSAGIDLTTLPIPRAADPNRPHGNVVYFGDDPERAGWLLGQFAFHGWRGYTMREFLADSQLAADLVVIDPRAFTVSLARKLIPVLKTREIGRFMLAARDESLAALCPGAAVLPPVITANILSGPGAG